MKQQQPKEKLLFHSLLLFIFGVLLYSNSLTNQFTLDDKGLILQNRFFYEKTSIGEIFSTNYRYGANEPRDGLYRPLPMYTYLINQKISGFNPISYHAVNILFHAINGVLLLLLFRSLTGNYLLSIIASILFVAHPIHTEAVANVAGRPELMMTFFSLIAWIFLESRIHIKYAYPAAAFFLFLGIISKETAAMIPFMVLGSDFLKKDRISLKSALARFFVLSGVVILYLIVRWILLGDTATGYIPRYHDNPIYYFPFMSRIMNAIIIQGRYLSILVFPWRLLSDYSLQTFSLVKNSFSFTALLVVITMIALLWGSIFYSKKEKAFILGIIIFIPPALLVSNLLFPIGTIMGERLMYLPSVGFSLIIAGIITVFKHRYKKAAYMVFIAITMFYSVKTIMRNLDWHDDKTLTVVDFKKAPDNLKLLNNMGVLLREAGDSESAAKYFLHGLEIYPCFSEGMTGLAYIALEKSDTTTAMTYYQQASECAPLEQIPQFNYASMLIHVKKYAEAEKQLEQSLENIPNAPLLYRSFGNLKLSQSDYRAAISFFLKAIKYGDNRTICYTNTVVAAYYAGDYKSALNYIQEATKRGVRLSSDLIREVQNASQGGRSIR